jgi:DNA-3-methyladenine glycosylase
MTTLAGTAATGLHRPLGRAFYARPIDALARALLGRLVVTDSADGLAAGRIVETEAYGGPDDRASHARAGLTARTRPMFGPVGHAYVYLVYGLHECLNVVGEQDGQGGAVLLRALEPVTGIELMRRRRGRPHDPDWRLAAGPARLAQALGVDRRLDGHDLTLGEDLWLAGDDVLARPGEPEAPSDIASGPRVGVAYAGGEWAARPWRFWLAGHRSVSRP